MNGFWLRGSPVRPLGCENRSRTLIPKIDNYVFNPSFFLCVDDCSQWPLYLLFHSVSLLGFFWGGFIGLETGFGWDWLGLCFFFSFFGLFFSFDTVDDVFLAFINEAVEKPRPEETDTIFFFASRSTENKKKTKKNQRKSPLRKTNTPPRSALPPFL